ncbi:hypothetical protein EPUL_001377 [Erysiphe pulchra]|uniref:3-phytase n=1 Tax=Erysiphe pulchra TaxID=225359 RepID=A0A2S4PWM7_9PEZI|nr:hypothetical protein EPUL_001377 [Erysiphe pulchra]
MENHSSDDQSRYKRHVDAIHNNTLLAPEKDHTSTKAPNYVTSSDQTSGMYRYGAIPKSEFQIFGENNSLEKDEMKDLHKKKKWWLATLITGTSLIILFVFLYKTITYVESAFSRRNNELVNESCITVDHGYQCSPKISRYWGQYSPYFSVPSDISPDLPEQCQITFAQVLSRHGARDPTLHKTQRYNKLIEDIQSKATSYSDQFAFIKDFKYTLGADMLSRFGQKQMIDSGISFYNRYKDNSRKITPFIRASGQTRVIESAQNWTQGFHKARMHDLGSVDEGKYPYNILTISEEAGSNNTLDHGLCREFEEGSFSEIGSSAKGIWASIFIPSIAARLNSNLPGVNFTSENAIDLMSICPFHTVANELGHVSPFCNLFSEDEWHAFDYYQTLSKYYEYSWGNPLGPTQGVGFTNELIARMTNKPVNDHTSTNSTLDSNPETFPISEKTILYADFSHDNTMIAVYSALGLFNSTPPLSNTTLEEAKALKGFSTSWLVPFGGRAYFEKMKCANTDEELVRTIINDRVVPPVSCKADAMGRCKLSDFISSLTFAQQGGNWDKC